MEANCLAIIWTKIVENQLCRVYGGKEPRRRPVPVISINCNGHKPRANEPWPNKVKKFRTGRTLCIPAPLSN